VGADDVGMGAECCASEEVTDAFMSVLGDAVGSDAVSFRAVSGITEIDGVGGGASSSSSNASDELSGGCGMLGCAAGGGVATGAEAMSDFAAIGSSSSSERGRKGSSTGSGTSDGASTEADSIADDVDPADGAWVDSEPAAGALVGVGAGALNELVVYADELGGAGECDAGATADVATLPGATGRGGNLGAGGGAAAGAGRAGGTVGIAALGIGLAELPVRVGVAAGVLEALARLGAVPGALAVVAPGVGAAAGFMADIAAAGAAARWAAGAEAGAAVGRAAGWDCAAEGAPVLNVAEPAPAGDFGIGREADSESIASLAGARGLALMADFETETDADAESEGIRSATEDDEAGLAGSLSARRDPESEAVGSLMDGRNAGLLAGFEADTDADSEGAASSADDCAAGPADSFGARREPESESAWSIADAREAELAAAVFELAALGAREIAAVVVFAACAAGADSETALLAARAVPELTFGPGRDPDSDVLAAAAHEPVAEVDFAVGERRTPVSDAFGEASRARDPGVPLGDGLPETGFDGALPFASAGCGAGAAADGLPPSDNSGRSN